MLTNYLNVTKVVYLLRPCYLCGKHYSQNAVHNYYDVLKLPTSATQQDIKRVFYERSKQLHPDKLEPGDTNIDEFLILKSAYETLSNKKMRALYDIYLVAPDCSQRSFDEWKKYNTNIRQTRATYNPNSNFKTEEAFRGMKIERGMDAKWSDFGFFDYFVIIGAVVFCCFVYYREKEKAKMRKTVKKRLPVIDLNESRYINKKSIVPVPIYTYVNEDEDDSVPDTDEDDSSPTAIENNVFDSIKCKGTVSEKDLDVIIKSFSDPKVESDKSELEENNIQTWRTTT